MISGSITLLAIAPLTNIAVALMLDPSFGDKLKNCVMMGGNYASMFLSWSDVISFYSASTLLAVHSAVLARAILSILLFCHVPVLCPDE